MEIAGQVAHGRRMDGLAVAQRDAVEITEPVEKLADVARIVFNSHIRSNQTVDCCKSISAGCRREI